MVTLPNNAELRLRAELFSWLATVQASPPLDAPGSGAELLDHMAPEHATSIRSLVQDTQVLKRLTHSESLLSQQTGHPTALAAIKGFLVDASWLCAGSLARSPPASAATRSDEVRDLNALHRSIEKMTTAIGAYRTGHPHATSQRYLADRLQAGNPAGFNRNRKGWWANKYSNLVGPDLQGLLRALANDVLEEATLLQINIEAGRQTSGKLARYHRLIDTLGSASTRLSTGKPATADAQLVTEVLNVLLNPSPPLDGGAVRKRLNRLL